MTIIRTPSGARIDTGFLREGTTSAGGATVNVSGSGVATVRSSSGGGSEQTVQATDNQQIQVKQPATTSGSVQQPVLAGKTSSYNYATDIVTKTQAAQYPYRESVFRTATPQSYDITAGRQSQRIPERYPGYIERQTRPNIERTHGIRN